MALETATFISDLNASNPLSTDQKREGDDHLRLIKGVLKATFPNASSAQNTSSAQIDSINLRVSDFTLGKNGTWLSASIPYLSNKDLNGIIDSGWAFADGSCGNGPGWACMLLTISSKGNDVTPAGDKVVMQLAVNSSTGDEQNQGVSSRYNFWGGGWSAWSKPNYNNTYVRKDGSQMTGNLTVGSGDYFAQLLGGSIEISAPGGPYIDMKLNGGQDYVWRFQATDAQLAFVRYSGHNFVFRSDGNIYTSYFGWLSDYVGQMAHANTNWAWDQVWSGNNQWNFNLANNWGDGLYLLQNASGEFHGCFSAAFMGGAYMGNPQFNGVSAGNVVQPFGSGPMGANNIWKLRKT